MRTFHRAVAGLLALLPAGLQAADLPGLVTDVPSAPIAEELAAFGRLIGSWDVEVLYHLEDGRVERRPGEWHFAWILEGRAIQDVCRVLTPEGRDLPVGYGTTIRAFDADLGAWRATWVSALTGGTISFIASPIAGEIVMESQGEREIRRWIFSDITSDSFRWRAVSTPDEGATWVIAQEMSARRRRTGA